MNPAPGNPVPGNPAPSSPALSRPAPSHTPSALATQQAVPLPAPRKDKAATLVEMCSIRVAQTIFGVPITHILEIVGGALPQTVPLAPGFIGGLVHYRGDVLTTVSLRHLLGLPAVATKQDILVIENAAGCFGLLVDAVGEVLTVSSADHEPNPSVLEERHRGLFAGAYKLQNSLLIVLDPERLDPMLLGAAAA